MCCKYLLYGGGDCVSVIAKMRDKRVNIHKQRRRTLLTIMSACIFYIASFCCHLDYKSVAKAAIIVHNSEGKNKSIIKRTQKKWLSKELIQGRLIWLVAYSCKITFKSETTNTCKMQQHSHGNEEKLGISNNRKQQKEKEKKKKAKG